MDLHNPGPIWLAWTNDRFWRKADIGLVGNE
jgi:hypothetical protein